MNKDTIQLNGFNQFRMPKLKGHVKITLHNPTTGKNEVVEGDNIVTNAVRDIMAANYMGGVDYSKMFPLWQKWYGGILCYENAHPTVEGNISPDDYFAYTQSQNPLTAHAGGTIIDSDHDDDMKRGNPAALSRVFTENSVKQVWEWSPSHGNGKITSLSLTHADTGDAGLGSDSYAFRNFSPVENISLLSNRGASAVDEQQNVIARYDDSHGIFFLKGEGSYSFHTASSKITVFIKKIAFGQAGLFQEQAATLALARSFTVDTSITFNCQPSYYFDEVNKRLWLFHNNTGVSGAPSWSKNTVSYSVIDCESEEEIDHGTITSDTNDLAPMSYDMPSVPRFHYWNIIKDGNYVYLPTSNKNSGEWQPNVTGFKKINLTSQADQETISFLEVLTYERAILKGGNFLILPSRVVCDGVGYTCTDFATVPNNAAAFSMATPYEVSSYYSCVGEAATYPRYIFANKLINTTKFNLQSAVQKTASQSMIIEYSLEEYEEEEE